MRLLTLSIILFVLSCWFKDTKLFWPMFVLFGIVMGYGATRQAPNKEAEEQEETTTEEAEEIYRRAQEQADKDYTMLA